MTERIKVLFVEDNEVDAEIFRKILTSNHSDSMDLYHVENFSDAKMLSSEENFDLVLLDLMLPDSQGLETLAKFKEHLLNVPVVVLTMLDDEALGLRAIKSGAEDYLVKGEWNQRTLSRVIRYAIERKKQKIEIENLITELRSALLEIKTLRGLISICADCKKIKSPQGSWQDMASYIAMNSEVRFTHGCCPDCLTKRRV